MLISNNFRSSSNIGDFMCNDGCFDCKNELNLCKLCVKKIKAECIYTHDIISKKACIDHLKAKDIHAEKEVVNELCVVDKLSASHVEAMNINSNYICSQEGTINKLCVNDLTVGTINNCVKYRAAVTFAANTVYTLGTPLNWDTIIDDPNGSVTLAPFSYTVPVSGYYTLSYYLRSDSLAGAAVIAGIPTGLLTLEVNGVELQAIQSPFLSFTSLQKVNLTSLVILQAGDVIKMKYEVLILDPVTGLTSFVGSVDVKGTGIVAGSSAFEIHYLSSLDCIPGQTCIMCPRVEIPCEPVSVNCHREKNPQEDPCDSCQ